MELTFTVVISDPGPLRDAHVGSYLERSPTVKLLATSAFLLTEYDNSPR